MRLLARALLAGAWLATGAGPAAAEPAAAAVAGSEALVVRYREDRVSLQAREAALDAVLRAIARESGAELVGAPREARTLTVAFTDVPVKEALERLVGAQNFALKYGDDGRLKAIELGGGRAVAPARPPAGAETENATPAKWYAFYKAFDRGGPIRLTGELREAIGKDEVGWDHLGNAAIAHEDPAIRRAALHAVMQALERDPERRDLVLASLQAMTDEELAAFARRNAHYRAEDLVRNAIRETSDRELKSRAREVLRQLRQIPYTGPRVPLR